MKKVIFANHKERQCGVHEYGINVYDIIKDSTQYEFIYVEAADHGEFVEHLKKYPDLSAIIYNYYPSTMSWAQQVILDERSKFVKQLIIRHETSVPKVHGYIYIDPSYVENGNNFSTGRPLLNYAGDYPENSIPHIGSFGFGFGNKGFPDIIKKVNAEFDSALIKIRIPFAYFGDSTGKSAINIANICKRIPVKSGINVTISHDFLETESLLRFLASNDINLFFYDYSYGRGISSVLDYALSVKRPICLTKSYQFRHVSSAPIFIEDRSIKDILEAGTAPLEPYYIQWSRSNLIKDYDKILDKILE